MQLQLHAWTHRSDLLQNLGKSLGNFYNTKKSVSINTVKFSRSEAAVKAEVTEVLKPEKILLGWIQHA